MAETKLKCEIIMTPAPENADFSHFTIFYNKITKDWTYTYTIGGANDMDGLGYAPQHISIVIHGILLRW